MEYFKILGVEPPRLNLDLKDLEKAYYRAALQLHPDKNSGCPVFTNRSALLNQAYRTLKEPWMRAAYLLESLGRKINSNRTPAELAELYFQIEEENDPKKLKQFRAQLKKKARESDSHLLSLFKEFDQNPSSTDVVKAMEELVAESKYSRAMVKDIEEKMGIRNGD
jgi:molecular chaperone HscB